MQPVVASKPPKGTGRPTTERDGGNKSTVQLTKDSAPAIQKANNKSPVQQATTSAPAAQSEMNSKSPVQQTKNSAVGSHVAPSLNFHALFSNVSSCLSSDARTRNSDLGRQLANRGLASVNVRGDGNCFFRAISMSLYGREGDHCTVRDSILTHLENNSHILDSLFRLIYAG